MPISDWLDLMPATVIYKPVSGRDQFGKPTYGTAVSYRARVSYSTRRVINRVNGQDAVSSIQVWLNGIITGISVDDEITLPDGTSPQILTWEVPMDEVGNHHMKLHLSG